MELIYSPDESGWYYQRYQDWKVSQMFATREEAEHARFKCLLEWE